MVSTIHPSMAALFIPPHPAPSTALRLCHHLPAVSLIFLTVIPARVRANDAFRQALPTLVSDEFNLADLARALPVPALQHRLDAAYYRAAFTAALHTPHTPFNRNPITEVPPLSEWLARLVDDCRVSPSVYVAVLIYLDRLLANCPALQLTSLNAHRLVAACLALAVKELEDNPVWLPHIALVVGISLQELKRLEVAALRLLEYRTYIPVDQFETAEAVYIAEAVDAADEAHNLIMDLAAMGVTEGLDHAIDRVTSWHRMESFDLLQSPDDSSAAPQVFEATRVWRPVHPSPGPTWNVKLCALAAALADLFFPGIPLRPRPGRPCNPEALVLAAWDVAGVIRFRALKEIILNLELGNVDLILPPLVKGAHLSRDPRRLGRAHKDAMGKTGAFLLAEEWDIVCPDCVDVDDSFMFGELDIVIPHRTHRRPRTTVCDTPQPCPTDLDLPLPDRDECGAPLPPLEFVPFSPPAEDAMWNDRWADARRHQLEQDFERRVLEGMARNGIMYEVESPSSSNSMPPPQSLPPFVPLVPLGFAPLKTNAATATPRDNNMRRWKQAANGRGAHGSSSTAAADTADAADANWGDALQFNNFAVIAGHSIWANTASELAPMPLQEDGMGARLTQDVSQAVALDVLEGEEESRPLGDTDLAQEEEDRSYRPVAAPNEQGGPTTWQERRNAHDAWGTATAGSSSDPHARDRIAEEAGDTRCSFIDELREERAQMLRDGPRDGLVFSRSAEQALVRADGNSADFSQRRRARYWNESVLAQPDLDQDLECRDRSLGQASATGASQEFGDPSQQPGSSISYEVPVEELQSAGMADHISWLWAEMDNTHPPHQSRCDRGQGSTGVRGAIDGAIGNNEVWTIASSYLQDPIWGAKQDTPANDSGWNDDEVGGISTFQWRSWRSDRGMRSRVSQRRAFAELCGKPAEGDETDDSPTVVLGTRFKAAKSNSGRVIVTAM